MSQKLFKQLKKDGSILDDLIQLFQPQSGNLLHNHGSNLFFQHQHGSFVKQHMTSYMVAIQILKIQQSF
jgi:hypothetical protein